jgi:hypothetical protein
MQSLLNEYLVSTGSYDRAPAATTWRAARGSRPARRRLRARRNAHGPSGDQS